MGRLFIQVLVFIVFRSVFAPIFIGILTALLLLAVFPHLRLDVRESTQITSYNQAVRRASPAVVNIYTQTKQPNMGNQLSLNSLGSGVIMNAEGYILTNYHVVALGNNITVALQDGRVAVAQVIGFDYPTDLAVLRTSLADLPVSPQSSTLIPQVGDIVLAIGNPLNVGQSVTQGIISAFGRHSLGSAGVDSNGHQHLIQTDAAINAGSSGGALVNSQGVLVGINSAALKSQLNAQGIGFAIPYHIAVNVMQQLIDHGRVIRGFLGVSVEEINATSAAIMQLPAEQFGVYITDVALGSAGSRAGILVGDMLVTINQVKISSARLAMDLITNTLPGTEISLVLLRNGKFVEVKATIEEDPRSRQQSNHHK